MDKITKVYDADMEILDGSREVISIINTDAIDRDNEVVLPRGMKKKEFQGNPVVFVNHDYSTLPIGTCRWIKVGQHPKTKRDVLIAKTYISDKTEFARDAFGLMQDGILRAFSVGFMSKGLTPPTRKEISERPELANAKGLHRDWDLYEYSLVGLSCNPEALTLAVSKGYSKATIDIISGKTANTIQAVKDIVEAVKSEPTVQKHSVSMKELEDRIAKHLDRVVAGIDIDRVKQAAIRSLTK